MNKLAIGLLVLCGVLVGIEFVYHKHPHFGFEEFPAFYCLFGFGVCLVVAGCGHIVRTLMWRSEDFYDQ